MSVFSALWKLIKTLVKKVFKWIANFIRKYWLAILVLAVVWFAPAIATWLTSVGAPTWMSSALTWVGTNVTPFLTKVGGWMWSGLKGVAGAAWDGFSSLSLGAKAAVLTGLAFALAPDEATEVVSETGHLLSDVVSSVVGAAGDVVGGLLSSPLGLVAIGAGLWLLFGSGSSEERNERLHEPDDEQYNQQNEGSFQR